MNFTAGNGT